MPNHTHIYGYNMTKVLVKSLEEQPQTVYDTHLSFIVKTRKKSQYLSL